MPRLSKGNQVNIPGPKEVHRGNAFAWGDARRRSHKSYLFLLTVCFHGIELIGGVDKRLEKQYTLRAVECPPDGP